MKNLFVSRSAGQITGRVLGLFFCGLVAAFQQTAPAKTFCFDLQYHPQAENLARYDFTVLDPLAEVDLSLAHRGGREAIAYISVGEIGGDAWYRDEALALVEVLGENPDWGSALVDITDPAWAHFVVSRLARLAVDKGYNGFFLDTVDVIYDLAEADPDNAEVYFNAMASLIKKLKAAYPGKRIITNRGFEIYDQIRDSIDGFLVESMFGTKGGDGFIAQDSETTYWLNERLRPVKQGGTPIYVVDYAAPGARSFAAQIAQKIQDAGYNALVMSWLDGTVLASLGVGDVSAPPPVPAPVVVAPPKNVTVAAGRNVTFAVRASGPNLQYQWQWKGVNVAGATGPKFVLSGVKASWAGPYTVVVRNAGGSVKTPPALLKVKKK